MVKTKSVWFMEGVSSQKDILNAVSEMRAAGGYNFVTVASHRSHRPEILSEADHAYIEPENPDALIPFMKAVIEKHNVVAIHAGKRGALYEGLRQEIEALGVRLITGASHPATFLLADDKAAFSEQMLAQGLAAVPSEVVASSEEVLAALSRLEHAGKLPCIKPVRGIYGMGFWILKKTAPIMQILHHPDSRIVHPSVLINTLKMAEAAGESLPKQIVMPFLSSPECSVDMLVEKGNVLLAVSRSKSGSVQTLENSGAAFDLACQCAQTMKADGLINVQTRTNDSGEPVLLEANLRPSGGIGFTLHSGVNLPGIFALRQLDLINEHDIAVHAARFTRVQVTPTHAVKPIPACTVNIIHEISAKTESI